MRQARQLIEGDDAKAEVLSAGTGDALRWYEHKFEKRMPPGFVRRSGEGHDQQWEITYNKWKFVVSTYEDGKTLWSANYRTPKFDHDDTGWGGGAEIEELPPNANLKDYFNRLKKMADKHPEVWKARHIPHMPDPESTVTYGY